MVDVVAAGKAGVYGTPDPATSAPGGTLAPAPPTAPGWRFQILEAVTRTWVDRDVDMDGAEVTTAVNGASVIRGRLPVDNTTAAQLEEWGHLIVAEYGEADPIVAIVTDLSDSDDGQWLNVMAVGFSEYPNGMPWVDIPYSGTGVDPLDIVRLIWSKLQNKPSGNLGVTVDATKSPIRLGTPESYARTSAKTGVTQATANVTTAKAAAVAAAKAQEAARVAVMTACGKTKAGLLIYQDSAPGGDRRSPKHVWIDKNAGNKGYVWSGKKWVAQTTSTAAVVSSRVATWLASQATTKSTKAAVTARNKELSAAKKKLSEVRGGEADPWTMSWWETLDVGQVIAELARDTPFEWRESSSWVGGALTHRLEIGYPALGARRTDIRFEVGVNVVAPPPLEEGPYASEVTVLGAGEGRAMRRGMTSGNPGRLRRAVVVQRKDIRSNDAAGAVARRELAARTGQRVPDTLEVIDHPFAGYGSFRPGDRVYLTGDAGWVVLAMWVRIKEMTVNCTSGAITLKVEAG